MTNDTQPIEKVDNATKSGTKDTYSEARRGAVFAQVDARLGTNTTPKLPGHLRKHGIIPFSLIGKYISHLRSHSTFVFVITQWRSGILH